MSVDRLRVVHVITTLTTGGAERQVELVAAASRHDVSVVALYSGGVVEDALRSRGIPVEILGMAGWRKALAIVRLARVLRRLRPDVVHVHLLSGQLWGIPAARLARIPVVVSTEHSIMQRTIEGRPKSEWLRRLYLALERRTDVTIAVSDETARRLHDWGVPASQSMPVVNPPVDFTQPPDADATGRQVRDELGVPIDALVVGSVGRLDPVKRHDALIRALAGWLDARHHLVIVGDGALRAELEALTNALGISECVHLVGPRPDVPRLLQAMDVFVSPSRDETFGIAIVEALAAGLPVVYAQCPALDGLDLPADRVRQIADDTDIETEQRDLAHGVEQVLASGSSRARAPRVLAERYGVCRTASEIDDLYVRLVERLSHR